MEASTRLLQQRLWRWHFWAGLMSLPLALLLAITGAIYLFKPQYIQWYEQGLEASLPPLKPKQQALSPNQLLESLLAKHPQAVFKRYTLARKNDRSIEIELRQQGRASIYWLDRFSGQVLASKNKDQQLMRWIKNLHGELKLGNWGSYVVELMAQWMIVLVIIGISLVLSRQLSAAQGRYLLALRRAFFPRLPLASKTVFWRRLHSALGIWLSFFILLLLISGLPWTQVWGSGFKQVQKWAGWDGPGQEWFVSLQSKPKSAGQALPGDDLWQLSSTEETRNELQSDASGRGALFSLSDVVKAIGPLKLAAPVEIQPPKNAMGVWTVRSMAQDRSQRFTVHYDRFSGEEIMRIRFMDHHPVKRIASYGIALHEGALFGWANQVLGVLTALGIVALVFSALIMWWRRRPKGEWGAPALSAYTLGWKVKSALLVLVLLLPLFALSLILVLLLDYFWFWVLKRGNQV